MQISKTKWTVVSFGNAATQQKCDIDREVAEVDRYIAGEHMVTEDLHIRNWGVLDGQYLGPAFRRKFKKGNILYGSRRTYLKKVAVADFDGITANTTFVIEPNREKIFPGLLPFLMLSDAFTEHSVKHSKGSVNPYINWKDIANFTFKLPVMDDQKRIADLLWNIDATKEAWSKVLAKIENLYKRYGQECLLNSDLEKQELCAVANINMGQSPPGSAFNENGVGAPFLQGNAEFGDVSPKHIKFTSVITKMASVGDVLLSVRAPVGELNIADKEYCIGRGLSALSMKDKELNVFLRHALVFLKTEMEKNSTGSTFKAINKWVLETINIPFGDKDVLLALSGRLEAIETIKKQVLSNIENIKGIQKYIINQIFGGL